MTLHGLIRKLQVDELVLPESSAAEMPVGAWGGAPRGTGPCHNGRAGERGRQLTEQGGRRPVQRPERWHDDRNTGFRAVRTRVLLPAMPSKSYVALRPLTFLLHNKQVITATCKGLF